MFSLLTLRPTVSQCNLLNTCSSPALNNFGEIVSPCLTPLLIGNLRLILFNLICLFNGVQYFLVVYERQAHQYLVLVCLFCQLCQHVQVVHCRVLILNPACWLVWLYSSVASILLRIILLNNLPVWDSRLIGLQLFMPLILPFLCSRTMLPSFHADGTVLVSMRVVNSTASLFHT